MQSLEILIYMVIAIIIAGSIIAVIQSINHEKQYHDYIEVFSTEEENIYKIESSEFPNELTKRWVDCRYGFDNMSFSVYVKDESNITRADITDELLKIDKCDIIDCKNKTNGLIVIGTIKTPKIINIRCDNNTLIVK